MIYTESKKLHLIEILLKENNDEVLKQVEKILTSTNKPTSKFANFSNNLSKKELEEFERNIEDGCEQINEHDWK